MIELDMVLVFLDPGFKGTASLSNLNHPTLTRDAVHAQCFKGHVILNGPEETGDFPWQHAYRLDVVQTPY
jgi:hypothetical protein